MDEEIKQQIVEMVHRRVKAIRSGDRATLDATYVSDLRNQYNHHDYEWYQQMIEDGFGDDVAKIEIEPESVQSPLPFSNQVTYCWTVDYKVTVEAVSGRKTLWAVAMVEEDEEDDENDNEIPKVVFPAFGGRTLDSIARGEHLTAQPPEESRTSSTESESVLSFHPDAFIKDVVDNLKLSLPVWARRFRFEKIRAFVIDCFPWHGSCEAAFLTEQEEFDESEYGKWAIADWRWNECFSLGRKILALIRDFYEGNTDSNQGESEGDRAQIVFECLAKAIQSDEVRLLLKQFTLADDFELGVFDPDDPEKNFCQ